MGTTDSAALPDYLSAQRAIEILDIKPQTLYAYVARGWIRAVSQEGTHQKLYSRDDVEKMRTRSLARAGHGPVAASALRWGEPVFSTSITEITPQGPRYRAELATDLARRAHLFEATADYLWTGVWDERETGWKIDPPPPALRHLADELGRQCPAMRFRDVLATLVQLLSATQNGNPEAKLGAIAPAARQTIQVLTGAFSYLRGEAWLAATPGETIAELLGRAAGVELDAEGRALLDAALTLSADHELAPATFAARVAASTGANLSACIMSGIVAFEGPLTGIGADRTEDLWRNNPTRDQLRERFRLAREQGKQIPGFNHPLYIKGDPRALYLLDAVRRMPQANHAATALLDFIAEAADDLQIYPSLPVGLVAVQLALGLPARSAGGLFLLGRIAGYTAHVQEQRLAGFLVRPRAKFAP